MLKIYCLIQYREQIFIRFDLRPGWPLARPPRAEPSFTPQFAVAPSGAKPEQPTVLCTAFNWVRSIKNNRA